MIAELDKRKGENLAQTFVPNLKGEEFIKQVGSNEVFINLYAAANGVGKSCVGAMIITNICFGVQKFDVKRSRWKKEWGEAPESFFDYPLFQKFPYLKKGRIISDPTTIREKIIPELKKWFPTNRYKIEKWATTKEGKNYEYRWKTDTGFEFDIMSTEQDIKEFESTDLGWVWIDEPAPYKKYLATIARGRLGMIMMWTMTPLDYSAKIKDEIYDKRDGKLIDYVTADVWDNCEGRGNRGFLTEVNINRMISQYPESEYESRVNGKFGHLLGLVHKSYEPKIHKIDPFDIDKENYCVVMALDTHPRVDEHILWMAIDNKNRKFIIDEMAFKGTDAELAAAIKKRERNWRVIDRLIDPSGFNEDKRTTEVCFADRMGKLGLTFRPGSKLLHECIRKTDEAFKYQMIGDTFLREPEVFLFNTNVGLDKELLNYVWDEYKGRTADEKSPKASPKDINDHFIENLHRLVIENYTFKPLIRRTRNVHFNRHAHV